MMSTKLYSHESVTRKRLESSNLLQYAKENREEDFFNDVTVNAEKMSIPGNRMILACHSPFFEAMFKTNMKEKYEPVVEIQGLNGMAVKAIIDYFYSESIHIKSETVIDMLAAADYLQVDDVKLFCYEFLKSIVSPQNSIIIMKAVRMYQIDEFPNWLYQYISDNLDDIAVTDDFKCLSKIEFLLCLTKSEKPSKDPTKYRALISWIKQDEHIRKKVFPELFRQLINLGQLFMDFIKDVLMKEQLIISDIACHQQVLAAFSKQLENKSNEFAKIFQSKVISFGGVVNSQKLLDVYNVYGQALNVYADFPAKLNSQSALKIENEIFSIGGKTNEAPKEASSDVWKINVNTQTTEWTRVASMSEKRYHAGAASYQNGIVVAGGTRNKSSLDSAEYYDLESEKWKTISSMNHTRSDHIMISLDGSLYALGGTYASAMSSVEKLKGLDKQWEHVRSMDMPRSMFAAIVCRGKIYAIGGLFIPDKSAAMRSVETYDPSEDQWTYVKELKTARFGHSACVLNDKILVFGGFDAQQKFVRKIESYDPENDTWSVVGAIDDALAFHTVIAV